MRHSLSPAVKRMRGQLLNEMDAAPFCVGCSCSPVSSSALQGDGACLLPPRDQQAKQLCLCLELLCSLPKHQSLLKTGCVFIYLANLISSLGFHISQGRNNHLQSFISRKKGVLEDEILPPLSGLSLSSPITLDYKLFR